MDNLILMTDSYKASHWLQNPPGTENEFYYAGPRGGQWLLTIPFGMQMYLLCYLTHPITMEMVNEAKHFLLAHGEPFNEEGWTYIAKDLNGKLPIRIRAIPEGTPVPVDIPTLTVESTDKKVPWVASWWETALLRALWYPSTVCTLSYYMKRILLKYLLETSCAPESDVLFKLHDFGARGASSHETACIGGAAHLVNFMGSDNIEGVYYANKYYISPMAAFSIPAMQHSTVTSWGREHEVDSYRNMLHHFAKPGAILACVSDSYDIYHACEHLWGEQLKDEVVKSGATVVIRPDSGIPEIVVPTILNILSNKFGHIVNSKGYKVINNVKVIQGDGVNIHTIPIILEAIKKEKYSTENVAFGMGSGLLQQVNRDTQMYAYKCSSMTVEGKDRDVYKDPITDKSKSSKKGRLTVFRNGHDFHAVKMGAKPVLGYETDVMATIYENGEIKKLYTLEEVRAHSNGLMPTLF